MVQGNAPDDRSTLRPFAYFRLATAIGTVSLVAFTLWIAGDTPVGRPIAIGILIFGLLQWWGLGRMARQAQADDAHLALTPDADE